MARTASCGAWLVLLAAGGLAAGCGAGTGGAAAETPVTAGVCTGPVPAHASPCAGAGLKNDAPRVVVTACTCQAPCAATPCAYRCLVGYQASGDGTCVAVAETGPAATLVANGDGTVTVSDGYGEATWLADAGCLETVPGVARSGPLGWEQATDWAAGLGDGVCGLRDGSRPGDWRLPTPAQLMHLQLDLGVADPFTGLQAGAYWTSFGYLVGRAGAVDLYTGQYSDVPKAELHAVWPVRD